MTDSQLRVLEYFLTRHFPADTVLKTLEIGAGASTILCSRHADRHTCICEDTDAARAAVDVVRNNGEFCADTVEFIFKVASNTSLEHLHGTPLDVVILGGPGDNSRVTSEFYALARRLRRGSVIVLRDTTQPSIKFLNTLLSEDEKLRLVEDIENTSFYWCLDAPKVPLEQLNYFQLRALEHFLTRHFPETTKLNTLEIGVSNATALFAQHASTHTCICEDTELMRLAADEIRTAPDFRMDAISFLFGAPSALLSTMAGGEPLDIAIIGGANSSLYLVPQYLAIVNRLRLGSILVLRDIQVPTNNFLYRILREDDHLELVNEQQNTVYFWCGRADEGDRAKSAWERFNSLHGAQSNVSKYSLNQTLPLKLTFDGWLRELPIFFKRGSTISHGAPLISGQLAILEFMFLNTSLSGRQIDIVIDIDILSASNGDRLYCEINGVRKADILISSTGPQKLCYVGDVSSENSAQIKLYCMGLGEPAKYLVRSLSINPVTEEGVAAAVPATGLTRIDGSIATFEAFGTTVSFFVHDRNDTIQAHHDIGQFYETEELQLLIQHIPSGARILDIGANIGNHTVWFEKVACASHIVVIEPQPRMMQHLLLNCKLNELKAVDFSKLGIALGRAGAQGRIEIEHSFNPAGAVIVNDTKGEIPIRPGDEVIADSDFDFVKIDVEGAEVDVIVGLSNMIDRCRPVLFVEVANGNRVEVERILAASSYELIAEYRRYEQSVNLLFKTPTSLS